MLPREMEEEDGDELALCFFAGKCGLFVCAYPTIAS